MEHPTKRIYRWPHNHLPRVHPTLDQQNYPRLNSKEATQTPISPLRIHVPNTHTNSKTPTVLHNHRKTHRTHHHLHQTTSFHTGSLAQFYQGNARTTNRMSSLHTKNNYDLDHTAKQWTSPKLIYHHNQRSHQRTTTTRTQPQTNAPHPTVHRQ